MHCHFAQSEAIKSLSKHSSIMSSIRYASTLLSFKISTSFALISQANADSTVCNMTDDATCLSVIICNYCGVTLLMRQVQLSILAHCLADLHCCRFRQYAMVSSFATHHTQQAFHCVC